MESFNLGYEQLRAVKPDIVMVSLPAAGLYGPLKDISTYGIALNGITGLDSLTGYVGGPPQPLENAYTDPSTAFSRPTRCWWACTTAG